MGSEWIDTSPQKEKTIHEFCEEQCPVYMAMGMTRDEYWNGDPSAVIDYRKADRIRTNRRNYEMWLQGLYIYDAYTCVAPVLIPFNKNGRISPYPKEPYVIFTDEREEKAKQDEIERDKRNQAQVRAWFKRVNESKGVKQNE